jgi:hypothetical protein
VILLLGYASQMECVRVCAMLNRPVCGVCFCTCSLFLIAHCLFVIRALACAAYIWHHSCYCLFICAVDPCTQEKDSGVGAVQLTRFYFNKITKMCESMIYFGSGGNRNNWESIELCARNCPGIID